MLSAKLLLDKWMTCTFFSFMQYVEYLDIDLFNKKTQMYFDLSKKHS